MSEAGVSRYFLPLTQIDVFFKKKSDITSEIKYLNGKEWGSVFLFYYDFIIGSIPPLLIYIPYQCPRCIFLSFYHPINKYNQQLFNTLMSDYVHARK